MAESAWPSLPFDEWKDTCETLHMWTQIVGKICLALTPPVNHYWNVTLRPSSRGLVTPVIPCGANDVTMTFDFVDHALVIARSDGATRSIRLEPRTVADFYRETMVAVRDLDMPVRIWPMPVEVPHPIRFDEDRTHASYDPDAARRFWRILLLSSRVMERFRSGFLGKSSPVHLFWGSFDLAVTRFSGRPAPERPGADRVTREAYSHEVISHGFWPGSDAVPRPVYYAYAAPEPIGLKEARVSPAGAAYDRDLSEFLLPYDVVRSAAEPSRVLMEFLESSYSSAADLAGWDRTALERTAPRGAPHQSGEPAATGERGA